MADTFWVTGDVSEPGFQIANRVIDGLGQMLQ